MFESTTRLRPLWRSSSIGMLLGVFALAIVAATAIFAAGYAAASSEPLLQTVLEPDRTMQAQAPAGEGLRLAQFIPPGTRGKVAPPAPQEQWEAGPVGEFAGVIVTGDELGRIKVQLAEDQVLSRDSCAKATGRKVQAIAEERTSSGRLVNYRAHAECMLLRGPLPKGT